MRILLFLLFLALYGAYFWVSVATAERNKRATLENKTFFATQLNILTSLGVLFAVPLVLTGYFDLLLVAIFFGAAEIGVVLAAILGGFFGSVTSRWGAHAQWAGGEQGMKHVALTLSILVFTSLIAVGYPVAVGISYFTLPPAELPARIFQYTLFLLFVGVYPLTLFIVIGALVSENLDEDTRTLFLINQLSQMVPNALWVALFLSSFGIAGLGLQISFGRSSLVISPLLVGVVIGFFLLTILIPYLIGAQRAKRWRTDLLEKQQDWITKVADVLESPAESLYQPKLAALQDGLDHHIQEFEASDEMIAAGIQIDKGVVPANFKDIAPPYHLARDLDPRFKHIDSLRQLSAKIGEIGPDLNKHPEEMDLEKAAQTWAAYLRRRNDELDKELSRTRETHTPALLIFSTAILPIFSVVLSEFAKWLWTYLAKSLP